ncbi:hypothetical protein K470DRAFT_261838 [Piedraia hortae CBS 480.64]|uniref:Cell division control protein n=1 Tax=Piedraia hortae CBS 480.64 TaxID=1314780 RepID=A0A6A7C8T3_9PEZI|nr:hypothetical protein K470DRAFT_261838 [Piedraia hortae CBS 480.64]
MPSATASDGPTVSMSFANNFWGKDDAGVGPLLDRMQSAKVTGDELKAFYTARAQLEEEYARKLLQLAKKPLGSCESGTLRMSLDVVRSEVESMGKEHQNIAGKMKSELEEPLAAFTGGMKERRKIVQTGIEKLLKVKNQQNSQVNKTRDRYEQDCLKIKGYLAQGHMVMGHEERKNKAKLEKTQVQMSASSSEYEAAVKVLEETTGKWNREWKAACDKFQDLEEERIDYFKSSLWNFANIASTVCVSDDASCEKIRLSLEDCEVEKDIANFIKDHGTGQEIPDPPKYINFCRGDAEDAMSKADSEDGDYSVAQFQRTMNPAFRSSSPQPSVYGSHQEQESSIREDMSPIKTRNSLQGDEAFNAVPSLRSSRGSAAMPPPLAPSATSSYHEPYALQASLRSSHGSATAPPPLAPSQASHVDQYNPPQIPHNPYPTDGMTQFCRIGAPSERSSAVPSPVRPRSCESPDQGDSDYSAPTSYGSAEPNAGGYTSPIKPYNGSVISGVSSVAGDDSMQKKRSAFFNSPFKGRSPKKEYTVPAATPTQRNTWTPATVRDKTNVSPTKPSTAAGSRPNPWQKRPSPSPEPEPVGGPRTDYQLNVGGNVFDVAPDRRKPVPRKDGQAADPIAQALAELKGVTKQSSVRQSADGHYGMPQSFDRNGPVGTKAPSVAGGPPPPAYDSPPVSRLGAPQPAHTSRDMQKTTERFIAQKRDMFNPAAASRPGSSMSRVQQQVPRPRAASPQPAMRPRATSPQPAMRPRAASPQPPRAASPNPGMYNDPRHQSQPYRAASPNPYGGGSAPRPRAQSTSPMKPHANYAGFNSRNASPAYHAPRAASPNPAYNRPPAGSVSGGGYRPSSRQTDAVGGAVVLAPAGDPYGAPQQSGYGNQTMSTRGRGASNNQRPMTRDGRPILHFSRAMYMYQAVIPEELSFAKGDLLAVLRHQDDGWWEAEVWGKNAPPGLVPSNYLKDC